MKINPGIVSNFSFIFFSLARIRKRRLKAQATSTRVEEPIKPAFCRLIESFDTITHSISFIVFSRTNRSVVRAAGQTASSEQETKMQKYIRTIIEDIKYTRFDNTRKSRASEKSSSLEFLSKRKPHRIFRVAKNYRTRWKYIQWDKPHLIINWISTSLYFRPAYCANRNFYRLCNYQPIVLLWQVPVQGKVIKNFSSTAHHRSIGSVGPTIAANIKNFFLSFRLTKLSFDYFCSDDPTI